MSIESKYHTFMDYAGAISPPGIVVPQQVYRTDAVFQPSAPVQFVDHGQPGIRLTNAIASRFSGLHDARQELVLNTGGTKIALRILWPGYGPWGKWPSVYSHTGDRRPITRAQLASLIARKVQEFYEAQSAVPSTEQSPDWWVSRIPFERLLLLELRHVSPGSWQPVLCLLP
ncbi:hypothetical protein BC629DRAFT_923830 [Irpex lacteus]|nr:hypothetical protein BC629DRAFT_923830 [Irpex lacteus]